MKHNLKKVGVSMAGFIVLACGIIMIPYPGPGWLVVFAGLGILSTEYDWAKRVLHFAKSKYDAWEHWVSKQHRYVRVLLWLLTAAVVVVTIWLVNGYGIMNNFLGLGWDWVTSPIPVFHG